MSQAVAGSPCLGAKPTALRETRQGRDFVLLRGEGEKKLETGFPCGMSVS